MAFAMSNDDGSARMAELDRLIELEEKRLAENPPKPRCKCGICAKCIQRVQYKRWRALHGSRQKPMLRSMVPWEDRRQAYLEAKGGHEA
jgi:hypothetical protein